MAKKKQNTEEEEGIAFEQLSELVKVIAPNIVQYQKVREPIIRRGQIINFIIMLVILLSVFVLAVNDIIDGSAATGLIGAVIGYVFGSLYNNSKK